MKGTGVNISGRECRLYKNSNAEFLLVQPIDEHDLEVLDQEVEGIVAASPSVWFPKWIEYATDNKPFAKSIYLSLGDKEEKTKNPVMAQVGKAIRKLNELLAEQIGNTILEWNPGNHFIDSEKRTAKGFTWVMNK